MVGPNTPKGGAGGAQPALTPAQKRRLRKQKLESRSAEEKAAAQDGTPVKPVAAEAATPASKPTAAPAAASSTKKKGKKLEETPAFVPAARANSSSDDDSSEEDDSGEGNIITANNASQKRSISALSAKAVLQRAEEERRKQALIDGSDDDDDGEEAITINKAYAKKFDEEKRKQTLSKKGSRGDVVATLLREAANAGDDDNGSDDELLADARAMLRNNGAYDEDDESGSSEDEDGALLTNELNSKISQTLDAIRQKKPDVYDAKKAFFSAEEIERIKEEQKAARRSQAKSSKSVAQVMSEQLLNAAGGEDDESEDEGLNSRGRLQKLADHGRLTYSEQQEKIKQAFLDNVGSDDEEEDDDVFKVKTKAQPIDGDSDDDEEDAVPAPKQGKKERKAVAKFTSNGQGVTAENSAQFLESYLSGEWWREKDMTKLPTYRDIKGEDLPEEVSASEDEAELDNVDTFEAAYNFRFQEPGNAYQIKSYPRPMSIGDSLRKEDNKRKTARETAKAHKEEEKLRKKEEVARLKAEKRKDLTRKVRELEEIAGLKDAAGKLDINDLLNNWDSSKHDELMAQLFSDDGFYADHADEDMDEDALRELVLKGEDMASLGMGKLPTDSKGSKKKKKQLDPETEEALAAASNDLRRTVDEFHDLETEGLLGTRATFKWKSVEANDFGLSMEELLDLTDKELNQKVSLKKLATYRDANQADYEMPHKRKRDEKMARINSKMAKREAWKKGHTSNASASNKKDSSAKSAAAANTQSKPKAASAPAAAAATPAGELSASQKRRLRKKKLEEMSTADQPSAKKQKTEA